MCVCNFIIRCVTLTTVQPFVRNMSISHCTCLVHPDTSSTLRKWLLRYYSEIRHGDRPHNYVSNWYIWFCCISRIDEKITDWKVYHGKQVGNFSLLHFMSLAFHWGRCNRPQCPPGQIVPPQCYTIHTIRLYGCSYDFVFTICMQWTF